MTKCVNLNEMTSKELKNMAKELNVKNWWTMKKAELIEAISWAIADKDDAGEEVPVSEIAEEAKAVAESDPDVPERATEPTIDEDNGENTSASEKNRKRVVKKQLEAAYTWIVGDNEKALTKEKFEEWLKNDALEEVYDMAMSANCVKFGEEVPAEMESVDKRFCLTYLKKLFKNHGASVKESTGKKQDLITYKGETKNLSQWAKELGMPGQTLFARIHLSNWSVEKAFETPVKKRVKKEVEEKTEA